jgi:tryptophan synthase beta subunit
VLICLSGRGDKDVNTVEDWLNARASRGKLARRA